MSDWKQAASDYDPAAIIRKEKADAWDEGANAWADDRWDGTGEGIVNPYREATRD